MVTTKLTEDKCLQLKSATKLYVGENNFEQIEIHLPATVCKHDISRYNIQLHVSNPDTKEYFKYTLTPKPTKSGYVDTVNVGVDLTDKAQTLELALYMTKEDEVGITNPVSITICEPAAEGEEILSRSVLIARITELEEETDAKSAQIESLNGQIATLDEASASIENVLQGGSI